MDVASGADWHLDIGLQVVEAHPLFSVLFREALNYPYISFFHLVINVFSVILTIIIIIILNKALALLCSLVC